MPAQTSRRIRRMTSLAPLMALTVLVSIADPASALAPVSGKDPTHLVQSTGNLYWTHNTLNEHGPSVSAVYRTSKSAAAGDERALHSQTHNGDVYFGALSYAMVGGTYYGYFTAGNYLTSASTIRRVPLAGGFPTTLATSPSRIGDLIADSNYLYWFDSGGLRRMSLRGGAVTTLATASSIRRLRLDATHLYYALGTTVRRIPKTGGPSTTVVSAASTVTALHIRPTTPAVVYWGESNNAVRSRPVGGPTSTHQGTTLGRYVTSVSFDGSRILWGHCTGSGNSCAVVKRSGGVATTIATGGVGVKDVQGDARNTFWGDVSGVHRFRH